MTGTVALLAAVVVLAALLVLGRGRLRVRLARVELRVARTWAGLDRALVRRAERAVALVDRPGPDPATALLVADAAAAALQPGLDRHAREQAESDLTAVLALTGLAGVETETEQVVLGRRLHNDAVVRARALRARPSVRALGLGGGRPEATPFEMAEAALGLRS